jgi:oxalate decarboxylase/phosphoglucose isomerase-like protein (cupin superfamily)
VDAGEPIEHGTFDPDDYRDELDQAPDNLEVGTAVWFENDRIRVWEVRLEPGERGPFHAHTNDYFWTVVDPGLGLQRLADGTYAVRAYQLGETRYLPNTAEQPLIHDLENVGETTLRFVTVELLG